MEIERKWLIKVESIPYDLTKLVCYEIEQAYISFSPIIRIRKINDDRFILTIKSSSETAGKYSRNEYEININADEYIKLKEKTEGLVISKTRYINRRKDGLTEEIDIFKGELSGLAYLEIEFPDELSAENFQAPDWVIKDVTLEKGFSNGELAEFGMPEQKSGAICIEPIMNDC
jgi:CYTH domain-containing protein